MKWLVLCMCLCVCARSNAQGVSGLLKALDTLEAAEEIPVMAGVTFTRVTNLTEREESGMTGGEEDQALGRIRRLSRTHVLDIRLPELMDRARGVLANNMPRFLTGKNSFLTGFGLGFLAFGLKKLLLPLFIGAQIVKSVLLAMFLPSIIGGLAKLMGKGLSSVAQSSSSSGATDSVSDFEFKDTGGVAGGGYDSIGAGSDDNNVGVWTYPPDNAAGRHPFPAYTASGLGTTSSALKASQDRYHSKVSYNDIKHHGSFYSQDKKHDFKVFHNIPASSHLLTNYDPFYSPLLSRLDSVFAQLSTMEEVCRERLVCQMYSNPAKFAPFSNLVSAQLSRELNELRKPSTDNPEILRFFRYMKAAKDGQDGSACELVYGSCSSGSFDSPARAPMLTTFNHINKLVHARNI